MNDLNSVLLEGVVVENAKCLAGTTVVFDIMSKRQYRRKLDAGKLDSGPIMAEQETTVRVECVPDVANSSCETILKKAKKGAQVRIVGRLQGQNGDICIVAEHVEWRPRPGKT